MAVFAVTRSRDEIDIIESSIRRMAHQVDHIIVGDNSTDGGHEVLQGLVKEGLPLTVHWEDQPNYKQVEVVGRFVAEALERGADWIVPFDLDEIWLGLNERVADDLGGLPEHAMIAPAGLLNHVATDQDDASVKDPIVRMGWREREVLPLRKVAFRASPDVIPADGNHSVRFAGVRHPAEVSGVLQVRHFPFRTPEQFVKRVEIAWPQIRDSGLGESYGTHVWVYGRELERGGPEALHKWFDDAFYHRNPQDRLDLVFDPLKSWPLP